VEGFRMDGRSAGTGVDAEPMMDRFWRAEQARVNNAVKARAMRIIFRFTIFLHNRFDNIDMILNARRGKLSEED
jgi:hypothetical protein